MRPMEEEMPPAADTPREWIRLAAAADLVGVSPSTLRRWGDDGRVACRRTPGGQRRFLSAEVSALGSGRPQQTPAAPRDDLRRLVAAGVEFERAQSFNDVVISIAQHLRTAAGAPVCDLYHCGPSWHVRLASVSEDGIDLSLGDRRFAVDTYFLSSSDEPVLEPVGVPDGMQINEDVRRDLLASGLRAGLLLPLIAAGEKVGEALLLDRSPGGFSRLDLLQGLSQLAAQAMANATLHRDLERHDRLAALVRESGLDFASSLDPLEVLRATAIRLCEMIDVPSCSMYRLVDEDRLLCVVSLANGVADVWEGRSFSLADWSATRLALVSRSTVAIASTADERLSDVERSQMIAAGEHSSLEIPLIARETIVGIVELLETRGQRVFSEEEIATVESVCHMAALAVENAELYRAQKSQSARLESLLDAGRAITSSVDLMEVLANVAKTAAQAVGSPECVIYEYIRDADAEVLRALYQDGAVTLDPSGELDYLSDYPADRDIIQGTEVVQERISDPDLAADARASMEHWGEKSCLSAPLRFGAEPLGQLVLIETETERRFTADEIELVRGLSEQAAVAIHNARLYDEVKRLHLGNLKALSSALSAKDYYTLGHAARVAAYMALLGRELGWPEDRLAQSQDAAYLHDIGKIAVSDRVLLKTGPLNDQEWDLMRQHAAISAEIARPLFDLDLVLGIRHHHERFDGKGYPDGIAGEAIPLVARAMCVVDSYDAMSCDRPYRPGLGYARCLDELLNCSGSQFDPALVAAFLRTLEKLDERRGRFTSLAEEAALLVDPDKHRLLRTRSDEDSPAYKEMVGVLRDFRDLHPEIRFITTFVMAGKSCWTVLDTGENEADVSHIGDSWFPHDELAAVLAGQSVRANVLNADQFGVWITCVVPIRDADGSVVAAMTVDVPAVQSAVLQQTHTDLSQNLASMLQAASMRWSRAELDAITDGLTGLYNHRYLHERLDEEIERAAQRGTKLSVLFCDLDRFKAFNDVYGHKTGDDVLRRVARVIERSTRRVDLAARYGGEEFVCALTDTDAANALDIAERIRSEVARLPLAGESSPTISIGVATYPDDAATKDELIDKADWAMYAAKRAGCDRTIAFSSGLVHGEAASMVAVLPAAEPADPRDL
jgi:diguanylate cyclase (GGDEF)-like protein